MAYEKRETMATKGFVLDGYAFATKEEYNIALREQRNINSIRSKMDINNKDSVLLIYQKLATKRLLISPIGIEFMRLLRNRLIQDFHMEETELPMIQVSSNSMSSLDRSKQYTNIQLVNEIKRKEQTLLTFKIITFALIVTIVAMFAITATSDHSGYFNVEERVLNKYSEWESELDQREQKIKDLEDKLGIDVEDNE